MIQSQHGLVSVCIYIAYCVLSASHLKGTCNKNGSHLPACVLHMYTLGCGRCCPGDTSVARRAGSCPCNHACLIDACVTPVASLRMPINIKSCHSLLRIGLKAGWLTTVGLDKSIMMCAKLLLESLRRKAVGLAAMMANLACMLADAILFNTGIHT